mmetsp:Transcript_3206/g.9779  ORF Transcript_3206/g.9779 Transcript_3206/m.9779 type:complete len:281 (-) Transcript_3206:1049-1891(-)
MSHEIVKFFQIVIIWLLVQPGENQRSHTRNITSRDSHERDVDVLFSKISASFADLSWLVVVHVEQQISFQSEIWQKISDPSHGWLSAYDSSLNFGGTLHFHRNKVVLSWLTIDNNLCNLESLLARQSISVHNANLQIKSWLHYSLDQSCAKETRIHRLGKMILDNNFTSGSCASKSHRKPAQPFGQKRSRKNLDQLFFAHRRSIHHCWHHLAIESIANVGCNFNCYVLLGLLSGSSQMGSGEHLCMGCQLVRHGFGILVRWLLNKAVQCSAGKLAAIKGL